MKSRRIRNMIFMGIATFVMALVLELYLHSTGSVPYLSGSKEVVLADGVYTAAAKGYLSDVTVTVTVSGGAVSAVEADASGETPELGGAAAGQLAEALLAQGGTEGVDAVSGATFTSNAVLEAARLCLAQAEG